MKTIAIANQKGGVGKSTTALLLGEGLKRRGRRVLLIDLDAQGNLTDSLDVEGKNDGGTAALFNSSFSLPAEIVRTPRADILPANPFIIDINLEAGKINSLRNALETVRDNYDYCIIDTPPGLGVLLMSALIASDSVIIPILAEPYTLKGLMQIVDTINTVRSEANKALKIDGLLLTRYSPRTVLNRQLAEQYKAYAESIGTRLYSSFIRDGVALREAQIQHASLYEYAPRATVTKDYSTFTEEFIKHE